MSSATPNPYQSSNVVPPPVNSGALPSSVENERPTNVRYGVLAFSVSMSILLYLHRFAISIVQTTMGKANELNLDKQQLADAQSAFFYVYAFAQVPAGWLSQRFGPRLMLSLYVLAWSIAFGLMGLANSLYSLIVLRGLLGLAQAGAYPTAASYLKKWFPISSRGLANSATATGGRFGSLTSSILTPYMMVLVTSFSGWATGNWRLVFLIYGVLGIVWSIAFWFWFRDTPAEHPACNAAERSLIAPQIPTSPHAATDLLVVKSARTSDAFYSPPLALMTIVFTCLINIFVNVGWIFLVTFLPTFLKERFEDLSAQQIGWLSASPIIASMFGGLLGGFATDRLVARFGLKWGRRLTGIIANGTAGTMYLLSLQAGSFWQYVVLFAAIGFWIDFGLGSLWAVYQDIAGKYISTVLGFANMCGNLSAAVFISFVIGPYAKQAAWSSIFAISCGALFITMSCWFFVNPNAKLTREDC